MFKPVNDNVILLKEKTEATTSTGIITDAAEKTFYTVVETNDHTKKLKDKVVYLMTEPVPLEGDYYACDYKEIVAYASSK